MTKLAKWVDAGEGARAAQFSAKLAVSGQLLPVTFQLRLWRDGQGVERLAIEKTA